MRALVVAALLLWVTGCGSEAEPAHPQREGAATVVTVGECLARAGARPVHGAADLGFVHGAVAGQVGIGLDGRTTYEFRPRANTGGDWRVFRTRPSDGPKPAPAQAGGAPVAGEEVAALPPPASPGAVTRARDCADGAPE